uniref:NADH dehydrogenase subunit 2 n=1 Tax=Mesocestoides sp. RKZ08 TaxID=2854038 RepID=UPI001F12C2D9|nr:NADH dehydrogenase subunit 2 [Mesocestoides sp. RKZ08]UKS07967.1 NADH dehydrogenase subunit 2 [Mesocestoides sp. RKZ08]
MFFRRVYLDVFFFSFFFSVFFCFCCSLVDNLFSFWVFLELGGLVLVPSFFYLINSGFHNFYGALFTYVVVSSVSSVLLVTGFLFSSFYYFVFLGFSVKFGLFPFSLWVYRVFLGGNWLFIFLLSVVMKFPVIFFCFLLSNCCVLLVYLDCFFTIILCSVLFWFFSSSYEYIWCHISLSSLSTLVVACFCSDLFMCLFIYFYYFVWSCGCLFYFYYISSGSGFGDGFWFYCFLFLVTPVSFPLFYKLSVCFSIFYSSIYILIVWSIYSFSEQIFFYKFGSDSLYSNVCNSWF